MSRSNVLIANDLGLLPWSSPDKITELCQEMFEFAQSQERLEIRNFYCLSAVREKLRLLKFINEDDVMIVLRCYEFAKQSGYRTSIQFS